MKSVLTAIAVAFLLPVAASAQSVAECQRVADGICAAASNARLLAATGDVLVSRGAGFLKGLPGAALVRGDRVLVRQGSAEISIGPACRAALPPNSVVTIVSRDGLLCATGESLGGAVQAGVNMTPFIVGGAGLLGVALGTGDSRDPPRPSP
jgi:hypothetical protein